MALVYDTMSTPPSRHANQMALIVIVYGRVPASIGRIVFQRRTN